MPGTCGTSRVTPGGEGAVIHSFIRSFVSTRQQQQAVCGVHVGLLRCHSPRLTAHVGEEQRKQAPRPGPPQLGSQALCGLSASSGSHGCVFQRPWRAGSSLAASRRLTRRLERAAAAAVPCRSRANWALRIGGAGLVPRLLGRKTVMSQVRRLLGTPRSWVNVECCLVPPPPPPGPRSAHVGRQRAGQEQCHWRQAALLTLRPGSPSKPKLCKAHVVQGPAHQPPQRATQPWRAPSPAPALLAGRSSPAT